MDPVNSSTTGEYYSYVTGGSWELNAILSSNKYRNDDDITKTNLPGVLSIGSDKTLNPVYTTNGLIGYWKFDEGTGSIAVDSSNNGLSGALTNTPTWLDSRDCKIGSCLKFVDGEYVRISDNNLLDITDNLTITFWINPIVLSTDSNHPFKKFGSTVDANFILYYCGTACGSDNKFVWYANRGGSWSTISSKTASLVTNQWYFLALTYENGGQLYINGVATGAKTGSGNLAINIYDLYIGNDLTGQTHIFDDVRIYNRALSAAEIKTIYNSTR
ncbi:MAG: LamG domain-containing protein [bacterium]|nr:LamG domain-containing protein [bacterium]